MRIGFMMAFDRERIEFAKKVGFRSCELTIAPEDTFYPGNSGWEDRAKEMRDYYQKNGIRISCLAGFYVNHMDPQKKEEHRKLVRDVIILAGKIAVPVVAGFPGRITGRDLSESLPAYGKIWSEHARFAEDHNVKIAFENCPMGEFHTPSNGINFMSTPEMWEMAFNEVSSETLGLEWDPSHLICQFIDPIATLRKFGKRVYHVHTKDAHVNRDILARYGFWHKNTTEHCFAGLGDTDWGLCIKELHRQGYRSDLNIEGWHDLVYSKEREDEGLINSFKYLSRFVVQD